MLEGLSGTYLALSKQLFHTPGKEERPHPCPSADAAIEGKRELTFPPLDLLNKLLALLFGDTVSLWPVGKLTNETLKSTCLQLPRDEITSLGFMWVLGAQPPVLGLPRQARS